ncbi:cytochrome c maturation protein CcmE [Saccharospirillum impatiens]|uniref:cytochrome c maturation protein CcmE n=1 Tax=Saccharospirillum impatiens TaxID=169438 RepID=UPI0004166D4C|nr:cytochrome c maturation protein CcmE [Saccharospirillum impatiens]
MNPKRKQRLMLILLGTGGVGVTVLLVLFALGQNMNFFYSPSDIARGEAPLDRQIRAGGMVREGSVTREDETLKVQFVVTDFAADVTVEYDGILPDLFREGDGVVAIGQLNSAGIVVASEVLAKHDETYMPVEITDALERAEQASNNTGADASGANATSSYGY